MATLLLPDGVAPLDADLISAAGDEEESIGLSLTPTTPAQLRALNAPDELVRDAAVAAACPESDAAPTVLDRIADFAEALRNDEGELVSSELVYHPVRVVACSAPEAAEAKVTTALGLTAAAGGELSLTIGGFGLKSSVKYTLTQDLGLECKSGEAKIGYIHVPFDREVRMFRPPGAGESFPVERLVPVKDVSRFGTLATTATVAELLEWATGAWVPLGGGDASFSDSRSHKLEVSMTLQIGVGDKVNKLGASVSLEGSVEVKTAFSLPGGSFRLRWLTRPAGAVVTDANAS